MGNLYQSKEKDSEEFKEPKMADEKIEIPKDTQENIEKKEESKEAKNEQEEVEISNENKEQEEHRSNEKEEEGDINNEEQKEEPNDEEKKEEVEEQNEQQNEENQEEVLKTPIKNRTYDPAENKKLLEHNNNVQRNKIIIESTLDQHHEARPINQINQKENVENQEINESYELNPEQNTNNINNTNKIIYHDIAFRSGKNQNNKSLNEKQNEKFIKKEIYTFKASNITKEPKDSNPKVHILSNKKKGNKKYIKGNFKFNSEYVDIPRNEYETQIIDNEVDEFYKKGMSTGEYKFIGEKTLIKENIVPNESLKISEEEINEELIKRKNKGKKVKKMQYEVIDKYYALTNITQKTIKKVEKKGGKAGSGSKYYFYESLNTSNINMNSNINSNINSFQGLMNTQGNYSSFGMMNVPMQYGAMNMNTKMNMQMSNMNISMPLDNYSRYFLAQINKIRSEPQSFIGVIEDSKSNIIKDRFGRIVYNGKIRVALNSGEASFDEAIQYLKELSPMEPLIYNQMLTVNPPMTEEEILDKNDLSKKVDIMTNMGINIRSFWRDIIKDPEISFLLMIIDDNGIKQGMRRKDILTPYMKYIGISSTEINNNFVCYITLA